MVNKPLYGRILSDRVFPRREEAEAFAKDFKEQYKEADISIKHDILRTPASDWRVIIYVKL